ncbi:MAG: (p)ppGpp synthetase, partial [Treponema sp.]|nr:(p)ppGpp synthetase [Treponema sp.]
YVRYVPYLQQLLHSVQRRLEQSVTLTSPPTYKTRVKSFESYYKKALRVKPAETAATDGIVWLSDIIGVRVICAFLEDLAEVLAQLRANFAVREVEHKGAAHSFKEFGYDSIHVLVSIPDDCAVPSPRDDAGRPLLVPTDIVCEIQIRTILQDAWSEVEHELIYKSEFSPFDLPLRRKLASINASLSLADIVFQEIRDYQRKLQAEVAERRLGFYRKVDETAGHIAEQPQAALPFDRGVSFVKGTIDDLILEAMHAHNTGDLTRATAIYTQIIDAVPSPPDAVLSVIYKHRGMAFFTQSDYSRALEDFLTSARFDERNFRALYYAGIVYAIDHQYEKAVDCYSHSLLINSYQGHTFFRRAAAHYELGAYERALADITAAQKLGMDDSNCRALHERIVQKLGLAV